MRERGLAETRWPEQQDVVERFGAPPRGLDENLKLIPDLLLTDVFLEIARPQRALEHFLVRRDGSSRNDAFGGEFVGFYHASIVPRGSHAESWPIGRLLAGSTAWETGLTSSWIALSGPA
jgi:hypothetical protein